jgi:hypothetical protein
LWVDKRAVPAVYMSLVYSESPTPSGLAYDKMKKSNISVGWKSDSRERRSGKTKKRLSAEGLIKTYLILLQPAKLRDQAGERVFSWDSRSIWDKGVLRQETEGDEACDCYREPTEGDIRRDWGRVWTPHTEDIFVFMVLKRQFDLCLELEFGIGRTYGVSEVTSHLGVPPTLGGQPLTRDPW